MSTLEELIGLVHRPFREALELTFVRDVAFIGNTGGHYPWEPGRLLDVDVCVFVAALTEEAGRWLISVRESLCEACDRRSADCELRIIRGPYKPARAVLERPMVLAHLAVFTEETYLRHGALLRWSWRKYACLRERARLERLAPTRPTPLDLLVGPRGVVERLEAIRAGVVTMTENELPTFAERVIEWGRGSHEFLEYCLSSSASMARHHARVLGYPEPDALSNDEFVEWYSKTLLDSAALRAIMRLKSEARQVGYAAMGEAPVFAERYLTELARRLEEPS